MNEISESVIGFDALYESMGRCRKGVIWKDSTARYCLNAIEGTIKLKDQLMSGAYRAKEPIRFKVTHPKERDITSIAFRDRVYQRSLNDNVIYPAMVKSFIPDNFACQKGKGTDGARERLKDFLRQEYRKNGMEFYVLQIDVKGYYKNMRHDKAFELFKKKLDPENYERAVVVLSEQYATDKGFDPGSQMVQIAGISFLDGLDHFIKERLRIKHYIRYMDDSILLHPSPDYLARCKEQISAKLKDIGLEAHPQKSRIYHIGEGIRFLGFDFKITQTGKVLMTLKPENVKAERKKLRRLVNLAKAGRITKAKADECYRGWRAHALKGDSTKLLVNMDKFYKDLWRNDDGNT